MLARVEANLARAQAHATANGYALRPHIKTHKLPRFAQAADRARRRRHHGAEARRGRGDGRCRDHRHLRALQHRRGARSSRGSRRLNERITLSVTADSPDTVAGYAATFARRDEAADRADRMRHRRRRAAACSRRRRRWRWRGRSSMSPGLRFGGLMTYPATRQVRRGRSLARRGQGADRAGGDRGAGRHLRQQPGHVARRRHRRSPSGGRAPTSISTAARWRSASRALPIAR